MDKASWSAQKIRLITILESCLPLKEDYKCLSTSFRENSSILENLKGSRNPYKAFTSAQAHAGYAYVLKKELMPKK